MSTAVVLCDQTIKDMLLNFARCLIFSTAPSFPALAAIKGGYALLKSSLGPTVSIIPAEAAGKKKTSAGTDVIFHSDKTVSNPL